MALARLSDLGRSLAQHTRYRPPVASRPPPRIRARLTLRHEVTALHRIHPGPGWLADRAVLAGLVAYPRPATAGCGNPSGPPQRRGADSPPPARARSRPRDAARFRAHTGRHPARPGAPLT